MENPAFDNDEMDSIASESTFHQLEREALGRTDNVDGDVSDDSDMDDDVHSESWESIRSSEGYDSSGTDDLDFLLFDDGDESDQSDDSSTVDDVDYQFYEVLNQHLEALSYFAPTLFGITLQMIYERIVGAFDLEEEKRTPAPQRVLDSLERIRINEELLESSTSCCVCFVDYVMKEEVIRLPCQHFYHRDCIFNWLKITSTCPTCRGDVKETAENINQDKTSLALNINNLQGHFNTDSLQNSRASSRRNSARNPENIETHTQTQSHSVNVTDNTTTKETTPCDILPNRDTHKETANVDTRTNSGDLSKNHRETEIW